MEMTADKLASVYLKIRDRRSELKRKFEEEDEELERQQNVISTAMLDLCKKTGVDSMRTPEGTIVRSITKRYWTGDWSSMYDFILQNGAPQLLERRIAQGEMTTWLAENPDKSPPGLNIDSRYTVTVRRSRK